MADANASAQMSQWKHNDSESPKMMETTKKITRASQMASQMASQTEPWLHNLLYGYRSKLEKNQTARPTKNMFENDKTNLDSGASLQRRSK
tara:strand:+ start:3584 stop:3856 length:273 start_codon:yes stop_codon:yes gene_type:complete